MDNGECPEEERSAVVQEADNGYVCSECEEFLDEDINKAHEALQDHTQ